MSRNQSSEGALCDSLNNAAGELVRKGRQVFSGIAKNQNQSNLSGQCKDATTIRWCNQNSKVQKNLHMQVTMIIGFGFGSDRLRKWQEFLKTNPLV